VFLLAKVVPIVLLWWGRFFIQVTWEVQMNEIEEMKISLAAKYLEVTPKTIYNWIEDGT